MEREPTLAECIKYMEQRLCLARVAETMSGEKVAPELRAIIDLLYSVKRARMPNDGR